MFSLGELEKLKQELFASLAIESTNLSKQIPKKISKKSQLVLKEYIETKSIAGLELFVTGVSEYLYFSEALEELTELQNNLEELKSFQINFAENLKLDFGIEEFRFIDWERATPKFSILQKILNRYLSQITKSFTEIEPKVSLKVKNNYSMFEKANGDPSTKGANVKLIQRKTSRDKINQIKLASEYLEILWSEGFKLFSLLTDKIHIVQSNGLVSYSHFHEQGISYINFIDRNLLESIDDLIHENSHHHLNLLLKKYKIIKKELKEEIFYSPWRKSLRPLYAILHASFTFSYGALLFYNIIKAEKWVFLGLESEYKERTYFRFIEETLYVKYSLVDLKWAIDKGLFTAKGTSLINSLIYYNQECMSELSSVKKKISSKGLKKEISKIEKNLSNARKKYRIIY